MPVLRTLALVRLSRGMRQEICMIGACLPWGPPIFFTPAVPQWEFRKILMAANRPRMVWAM